jgi:hypothetical protein
VPLASYLLFVATTVPGLVAPDPAKAAKPVQVEFDAPAGCSGAEAFFGSLRSRTDQVRQADPGEPHTTLQVRLSRTRGHILGELRVVDDRGGADTRKVQGASCDDVVQALSLTAALAVDPSALLSAPVTAPEAPAPAAAQVVKESPATKVQPEANVQAKAEVAPANTPVHAPRFELGLGPMGSALLTSSAGLGGSVAFRWTPIERGVLRPTLGLAFVYLRNDVALAPGEVQIALTGLAATACPFRASASIITFEPCALLLGGWLAASGRQTTRSYSVDRLWLSAGGILRVAALLGGGFWLDLQAGVSAPFFKRRFFTTTTDHVVGETPIISPIAGLGLAYGF